MLLRFRVSNFRSLMDKQELSMVASSPASPAESLAPLDDQDLHVLPVAAIYGANAAGKSNVIDALRFMSSAVAGSHRSWRPDGEIPREPFLLDEAHRLAPSTFEADFLLAGKRYQYGFTLDSKKIQEEWLYAYQNQRRRVWFHRKANAGVNFTFGKSLRGNNRTIASLTRENSLFLSAAAENNHEMLSAAHSWFVSNLTFVDRNIVLIAALLPYRKESILDLLRLADLGITNIERKDFPEDRKNMVLKLVRFFGDTINEDAIRYLEQFDFSLVGPVQLTHASSNYPGGVALPIEKESQGTQALLMLTSSLLITLERGGVLCVDELDRSLHPRLALEIVHIFKDPRRNPKKAQLIFNTHDTTLLGDLLGSSGLRRDEVWFVEKDRAGATHLYPLTDFKPRPDENLERGYLQGRYGAIPFLNPAPFAAAEDD
jgi:hypothetical protein